MMSSELNLILRERRLRCFGHMEHSSGAVRTACDIQIDGRRGAGRPKLTWKKLTEKDCREDLLCVQLASYLESGPLMWMMPLHLHINQKSGYDDAQSGILCDTTASKMLAIVPGAP